MISDLFKNKKTIILLMKVYFFNKHMINCNLIIYTITNKIVMLLRGWEIKIFNLFIAFMSKIIYFFSYINKYGRLIFYINFFYTFYFKYEDLNVRCLL